MISKSQEETEVSLHLEEWGLEASMRRLGDKPGTDGTDPNF
jgi:hypothetical protein